MAVAQHGIESIGDGDDACPERNLFTAQATWIARTKRMICFSESSRGGRVAKNLIGNSHLADVMKKCGASQHGEIRPRNGNTLGNGNRIGSDALAMGRCLRVFKFKSAR